MVILQEGLNRIRDLVDTDIDYGWIGTSGTAPLESQTALQNGVEATKQTTTDTTATKTLVINYTCPSTAGTGNTYREWGAISSANTTDYNRMTFTGIEHTENEDIIVRQTFSFRNA
jgi:hypothetical protein